MYAAPTDRDISPEEALFMAVLQTYAVDMKKATKIRQAALLEMAGTPWTYFICSCAGISHSYFLRGLHQIADKE